MASISSACRSRASKWPEALVWVTASLQHSAQAPVYRRAPRLTVEHCYFVLQWTRLSTARSLSSTGICPSPTGAMRARPSHQCTPEPASEAGPAMSSRQTAPTAAMHRTSGRSPSRTGCMWWARSRRRALQQILPIRFPPCRGTQLNEQLPGTWVRLPDPHHWLQALGKLGKEANGRGAERTRRRWRLRPKRAQAAFAQEVSLCPCRGVFVPHQHWMLRVLPAPPSSLYSLSWAG